MAPKQHDEVKLYVTGGRQRGLRPLAGGLGWYEYDRGLILEVDPRTGTTVVKVEYESPPEVCPDEQPVIIFKSGTLAGDRLYVCTQTELLTYRVPGFELTSYISLPVFNDIHHVRPTPWGTLVVANAGLDMVLEISETGTVLNVWPVYDDDPWVRFSREIDYRKVRSTKPHKAHPNHVFILGEEVWATRFEHRDAVCLTVPGRAISIGLERPHDGVVRDGRVYFTTVDGKIAIANASTLKVEQVIDLTTFHEPGTLLGWARGILVDDGGAWVGFSRIRPTKFRENVSWAMRGFSRAFPTHIAYYDFRTGRCERSVDLEPAGLGAVFTIVAAPES
jgi:hypothetical protein